MLAYKKFPNSSYVYPYDVVLVQVQYKLPGDGRRPKHVGAIFV
jgi:hypothetical protein